MELKDKKPVAWAKIQNTDNQIKNNKSVALIQMQIDYSCPLRCAHCAITKFRENIKEKLSVDNIKSIAEQAHNYGIFAICMSGGEPLTFKNLDEIIDAIEPERFVLSMDTNGMFLDEEKIKWLVNKKVDRIHLSLDGLEANNDSFRQSKGLWKHNIEMLPMCSKHDLGVVVNIVATKELVKNGEIEKQLEFIKDFGFHASLIYAKPVGSFKGSKDQVLDNKDFEYLESLNKKYNCSTHLTPAYGRDLGCMCFKRHFSVLPNGMCLPCPWIPISMGNVLKEGLETVIERGLDNKWFKYGERYTCHSGNIDSEFYKKILPQIDNFTEYPVDHTKINWAL